jgi:deoxyribodipyrimidine photo-lyase
MTPLDQQFNNFELGVHYPHPIVDIKIARKKASDTLWEMKKNSDVQKESERILKKHMLSDRSRMLKTE